MGGGRWPRRSGITVSVTGTASCGRRDRSTRTGRHPGRSCSCSREMRANPAVRWLFWTDADAVIMDRGIRLEDFLDSASDLILTRDRNGVNTGVFFVRNVPAGTRGRRAAYSLRRYTDHPWWEQAAVAEVLRASDHGLRVRLAEKTLFNAYGHEYRPGQFIVHFAGVKSGRGPRVLRALATSADSLCKGSDVRV